MNNLDNFKLYTKFNVTSGTLVGSDISWSMWHNPDIVFEHAKNGHWLSFVRPDKKYPDRVAEMYLAHERFSEDEGGNILYYYKCMAVDSGIVGFSDPAETADTKRGAFFYTSLQSGRFEVTYWIDSKGEVNGAYIDFTKDARTGCKHSLELNVNVYDWYEMEYPTDDLAEYINPVITFFDVLYTLVTKGDIYATLGVGDSVVRERVFAELAKLIDKKYNYVYNMWLAA